MIKLYKYRKIYSDIKKNILTNHYRAGSMLPTQEFFSKKYDVSRVTLKKALELLENEGLIYSKQGSGTFVRRQIGDTSDSMLPLDLPIGTTYSYRDHEISSKVLHFDARLPNENEQTNLYIKPHMPVYEYKRVRYVDKKVYSYEHTIMPVAIGPLSEEVLHHSVYEYLGHQIKLQITDARRVIYAAEATEEVAEALEIDSQKPVLVIEQVAYDQNGHAFEHSKSYFHSKKIKFAIDVHVNQQYGEE